MGLQDLIDWARQETNQRLDLQIPPWLDSLNPLPDGSNDSVIGDVSISPLAEEDELIFEGVDQSLDQNIQSEIGMDIQVLGSRALAFYIPFHYGSDIWGIFIRGSGVQYLAEFLAREIGMHRTSTLSDARQILQKHELFHARAEIAATNCELSSTQSIYPGYFHDPLASKIEESAGNAFALRGLSGKPLIDATETFMSRQPSEYRDFKKYRGRPGLAKDRLTQRMQKQLIAQGKSIPTPEPRTLSYLIWPGDTGSVRRVIPVYLISEHRGNGPQVVRQFPRESGLMVTVHSNDHVPVHFHVETTPGIPYGKYTWPELRPADKDIDPLTSKMRKRLVTYLRKHGNPIRKKLESTYGVKLPALRS